MILPFNKRPSLAICAMLLLLLLVAPRMVDAENKKLFRFANMPNAYRGDNVKEMRLATQMFIKKAFHHKHPDLHLQLDFLRDNSRLLLSISANRYDAIIMTGLDYMALKDKIALSPLALLSRSDQPTEVFLLMAQKNTTWEALASQTERSVSIEKGNGGAIAKAWINSVLADRGLPDYNTFFTNIQAADKPNRAILPVFFGQVDVCVISQAFLNTMTELNPQIQDKLTSLERSPGFINVMLCGTDQLEPWGRSIIMEETMAMHTHTVGQQALTIIQMKRFFPIDKADLKATESLYRRHQRHLQGDR